MHGTGAGAYPGKPSHQQWLTCKPSAQLGSLHDYGSQQWRPLEACTCAALQRMVPVPPMMAQLPPVIHLGEFYLGEAE